MRSIQSIHNEILTAIAANPVLANLNSTSNVAIYRLFAYIIAAAMYVHERLFDAHKKEVDTIIFNQKGGRLPWYRTMALAFQYGFDLIDDTDKFDNTGATAEQIEASKIIKNAAVNESDDESRVIIKIATETAGELSPITAQQRDAVATYFKEIKWAGIKLTIINYLPDLLFLNLLIQRDPLVLDSNGMSILNGNYPVNDAIQAYMRLLPFDGEFVVFDFLKYIQANAEGVIIPTAINVESSFIDPALAAYGDPVSIDVKRIPESGYFKVDNFDTINYVV